MVLKGFFYYFFYFLFFMITLFFQLQHFKNVELAKMRLEEQEKSRKEIQELRQDAERTHQLKSEALICREKNAIERLQKQQEVRMFYLELGLGYPPDRCEPAALSS